MLERTGLFAESWNVAWRMKAKGTLLSDKETEFFVIPNSFFSWAADPFLFKYGEETYIFAELYDYISRRGTLGYCKLEVQGVTKWKKVVQESYHLSYPFIKQVGDEIYIIPESGAAKTLYAYRAVEFPDKWEKVQVIRENVLYGDTTPFMWNEHPFALTYDVEDKYKLVLLDLENDCRDRLVGEDTLNIQRPAGAVFRVNGEIMRPAQNCTHTYGEGLVFYKIKFDGEQQYTETEVARIYPEDLNLSRKMIKDGMHTYNATDSFEVIDIKTRRFNILNFICRLINKIGG